MIDLIFYSEQTPQPRITTFMVVLPESLEREIIDKLKKQFGNDADIRVEKIKVSVFQ